MQEVMQYHAVQRGFQPDFHGAGERSVDRPSDTLVGAIFDDVQPQIWPPPSPVGRIADSCPDAYGVGRDKRLVGNLNAVHGP